MKVRKSSINSKPEPIHQSKLKKNERTNDPKPEDQIYNIPVTNIPNILQAKTVKIQKSVNLRYIIPPDDDTHLHPRGSRR